jgi:hypothetical protein
MKYLLLVSIFIFSGCFVTSKEYNAGVDKLNDFHKEFTGKTAELAEAVIFISDKGLERAKKANDMPLAIEWADNKKDVQIIAKDLEKLSDFEMEKSEGGAGAFMRMLDNLINMILNNPMITGLISMMGGGGVLSMLKMAKDKKEKMEKEDKIKRLQKKGKVLAESTDVNQLHEDEDFD